jgi:hypothetical protein
MKQPNAKNPVAAFDSHQVSRITAVAGWINTIFFFS